MKKLIDLSNKELESLISVVSGYSDINKLKEALAEEKVRRDAVVSENPNVYYFTMEKMIEMKLFDPWELRVLQRNNILNLQQLIDCDLDSLEGISPSIKEGLDWARRFYDMRDMVKEKQKRKKRPSNKTC